MGFWRGREGRERMDRRGERRNEKRPLHLTQHRLQPYPCPYPIAIVMLLLPNPALSLSQPLPPFQLLPNSKPAPTYTVTLPLSLPLLMPLSLHLALESYSKSSDLPVVAGLC